MMNDEAVELFSQEWCERAKAVWDDTVVPNLLVPEVISYVIEWGDIDSGAVCQTTCEGGKVLDWVAGKPHPDEECHFIFWGTRENWRKVGEGKLDPVAAVASKRLHMRRGLMPVVIKEADAFKKLLVGFGRIPTAS